MSEEVAPGDSHAEPRKSPPARTVLLVDDDADIRNALSECLREEGYDVRSAEHGLIAKKMLQSGLRPGVIVLDLMMPVMSGFDLLENLRRHPEWKDIRVLILSAHQGNGRDLKGAFRVLRKPVDFEPLREAIELALAA